MWYEATVRYLKMLEDGRQKRVSERYLVAAVSVTEAEALVVDNLSGTLDELEVKSVSEVKAEDVRTGEGRWYKAKVMRITIDERGNEKKTASVIYLQADCFGAALKRLGEMMADTMSDWETHTIQEVSIVDLIA